MREVGVSTERPFGSSNPSLLEGSWLSEGYGLALEFADTGVQIYEVSPLSCIPTCRGTREGRCATFLSATFALEGTPFKVEFVPTGDPNRMLLRPEGRASHIVLRRATSRLVHRSCEGMNGPELAFRVFWATFRAHHPFLEERGVHWGETYRQYARRICGSTTSYDLFHTLREMIEPLQDYHTSLTGDGPEQEFSGFRLNSLPLAGASADAAGEIIQRKYLCGQLRRLCNGQVLYARLANSIGYLCIRSFFRYAPDGGFQSGRRELRLALDHIMGDLAAVCGACDRLAHEQRGHRMLCPGHRGPVRRLRLLGVCQARTH